VVGAGNIPRSERLFRFPWQRTRRIGEKVSVDKPEQKKKQQQDDDKHKKDREAPRPRWRVSHPFRRQIWCRIAVFIRPWKARHRTGHEDDEKNDNENPHFSSSFAILLLPKSKNPFGLCGRREGRAPARPPNDQHGRRGASTRPKNQLISLPNR